jgi:multisubunit Na+/H+ antiporter MnhG subunit
MSAAVITALTPQSNDATAAVARYQDAYQAAEAVVTFSRTVKLGGIFLAGVIYMVGVVEFILDPREHVGFPLMFALLVACAVLSALASQVVSMGLRGEGQLLKAALDSDVNSSPFLSNTQRALAMSLRKRLPVPTCLPIWTE